MYMYLGQNMFTWVSMYVLLFEYLALCGLWVSKVHDFIEEFIDEDKVISYALFFQLAEVLLEHLWGWELGC